ncbi:hypothetical protein PISMIDRAFT_6504 [Pisolithus microcarpus 441]|uniref:Uncharacterized protein n=1 Tax=Pisolithus microcarpus 441 TaxID=765257 RepID=A0A0C9ZK70_9AGAM|nr:hypothetical protein BKA83DRAFT_6504 [Pisolithus microcarpus]KIK29716.1 hypothetical protein PISMIDRAFT_6504 [Pisolithus microcarpus 441]
MPPLKSERGTLRLGQSTWFNKLLHSLFPPDTEFTVVLEYPKPTPPQSCGPISFLEVFIGTRPVFILELNARADLMYESLRQAADEVIRARLGGLASRCPIPTVHAVSAMGTRLRFYHLDTTDVAGEIAPLSIPRHPTRVTETAPKERWDCDVLDADGEARLRAVVDAIKEACENVADA